MSFAKLGLEPALLRAVEALGYSEPTPIQHRAIPVVLAGRDLLGSAQTGTGKTAAFGLPLLQRLGRPAPGPRALVLEPTRELAGQVESALRALARFTGLRIGLVHGGVGYGRQNETLRRGVDVLVATPGRLLDHMERGTCRLDRLTHVVLDEADRMLDMGFLPDVKAILQQCPQPRQTLLFSATLPPAIVRLIRWAMHEPETVQIGHHRTPAETVTHRLYPVAEAQKEALLLALLERLDHDSAIVFCRTKQGADRLAALLRAHAHAVAVLHADRSQVERERALAGFRSGRYDVLVATDIASRGLDIPEVSHVINFDVPLHPEDYVHRIGRTGRASNRGDALTLMTAGDVRHVRAIEGFIKQSIPISRLEGFDYRYTALFEAVAQPQRGRTRWNRGARGGRIRGGYSYAPGRR